MRYTLGDAQDDMLPPRLYNAKRDADISSIQLQHQAITSASTLAREMLEKEVARKNADKDRSIIDRMSKLNAMPLAHQPDGFAPDVTMYDYQKQALHWMLEKHSPSSDVRACILADEMGLGKTLQTIALMLAFRVKHTLIVVPMSLLEQWRSEIEKKTVGGMFKVHLYHGNGRDGVLRKFHQQKNNGAMHIVITTHALAAVEAKRISVQALQSDNDLQSIMPVNKNVKFAYTFGNNPLHAIDWHRVVVDEAHILRNRKTQIHIGTAQLRWSTLLLLTGTPIVNNVGDMHAMLCLMKHPTYSNYHVWNIQIARDLQLAYGDNYRTAKQTFDALVDSFMLRRVKGEVIRGSVIAPLPPVTYKTIELTMEKGTVEEVFYSAVEESVMATFSTIDHVDIRQQYSMILVLLLRLRQAACHPYLIGMAGLTSFLDGKPLPSYDKMDWSAINGACQSIINKYRDLSSNPGNQQALLQDVVGYLDQATLDEVGADASLCNSLKTSFDHCTAGTAMNEEIIPPYYYEVHNDVFGQFTGEVEPMPPLTLASDVCDIDNTCVELPDDTVAISAIDEYNASSKLNCLMTLIGEILELPSHDKLIIFSQFNGFLDIIQHTLNKRFASVGVLRIDGKTSQTKRSSRLQTFKTDPNCRILLLNLKVGGVGLDLSVANHVILMDLWWNSAMEEQAQDRVKRVGQTKPVTVYRFLFKKTIEERVEIVKAKKNSAISSYNSLYKHPSHANGVASPTLAKLSLAELKAMMVPIIRDSKQ